MRTTQRKGDIATAKSLHTFTSYVLIVDEGTRLFRVQCKYTTVEQVGLRRIHSNSQGYVVKFTRPNAYDWLYILHADGREYLVKKCLSGRNGWKLRPESLLGAVAESG